MGLDLKALTFILTEMQDGLSLRRTVTLGRQSLVVCPAKALTEMFRRAGVSAPPAVVQDLLDRRYADDLLKFMGSRDGSTGGSTAVDSIDMSDFEGSTLRHDMNAEIPAAWRQRFTAVIDGGTLEHVFNFPVALRNCMEMLECGGRFLSFTITNGASGHGFYQFSPELYFRAFSTANGFRIRRVLLQETGGRWYEVLDPATTGRRAEFSSALYTSLFVSAERTHIAPVLLTPPQQSDYSEMWAAGKAVRKDGTDQQGRRLAQRSQTSHWLRTLAKFLLTYGRPDRRSFRRVRLNERRRDEPGSGQ